MAEKLKIPLIISGGSVNSNSIKESLITKSIISYENTFYEINSKNSYETGLNLKDFLKINNIDNRFPGLLVTSNLHNLRMSSILKSQGYDIKTFEDNIKVDFNFTMLIPDSRAMNNKPIYEYLAIVKYISLKYIKLF